MSIKRIYVRPARDGRPEEPKALSTKLKDRALSQIEFMMKVFDLTCKRAGAYTDEVASVYSRLLGSIEMVHGLGLISTTEFYRLHERAADRRDSWSSLFEEARAKKYRENPDLKLFEDFVKDFGEADL